jgi:hypothetical protein
LKSKTTNFGKGSQMPLQHRREIADHYVRLISIAFVAVLFLLTSRSLFADEIDGCTPPRNSRNDSQVIFEFASLGIFADRGFVFDLAHEPNWTDPVIACEFSDSVPHSILDLLSDSEREPQIKKPLSRLIGRHTDCSPKAVLARLSCRGLIELFNIEDTRLLDSPLFERAVLMEKVQETYAAAFGVIEGTNAKEHENGSRIAMVASLRQLNFELDKAVIESLTESERQRVCELTAFVMPSAIRLTKKSCESEPFGSELLRLSRKVRRDSPFSTLNQPD